MKHMKRQGTVPVCERTGGEVVEALDEVGCTACLWILAHESYVVLGHASKRLQQITAATKVKT